ncbi:MAG TPA: hypothetical protein VFE63_05205 [Roseiarcus sp.]|nr:hypothetical protein [Roseiarcus sp.]
MIADIVASETLSDSIVRHGADSIRAGSLFEKPYPHLIFQKFFSPDVYRKLLASWPDIDRYVDLNGARTRKQYTLWDRQVEAGDPERSALWRTVSDALSATEIEAALRERLKKGLKMRAKGSGEVWPVPMYPQPVLYADFDGYAIKPHPDTRRKVLTMLIYMPEDESQRELGTTVYKISPMGVFAWKSYGLVKEKSAPFLPNTGFAFVVIHPAHSLLHASWHGRDTISIDNAKPRMTLVNTYYAKPPKAGENENEYR